MRPRPTLPAVPIPDLDAEGLLPEGLHDCTLDEVEARFGQFTRSDRRVDLVRHLRTYCTELKGVDVAGFLVLDGSFVTAKEEPGDIDILLALRSDADLAQDFRPFEYNALSKRRVKARHPFDLLVAPEATEAYEKHLAFFSQVKGRPGLRKGLLRVAP
jgi:hypothetical protein